MDLMFIALSVLSIWGIAVIIPGPNFFIAIQATISHSRKAGVFTVLGVSTGTIIWSITGFFGISYLFMLTPWFYATLKMLGGNYLIYLGLTYILNIHKFQHETKCQTEKTQNYFSYWAIRLLTNLSNPKTALFITSLFATIMPKEPTCCCWHTDRNFDGNDIDIMVYDCRLCTLNK